MSKGPCVVTWLLLVNGRCQEKCHVTFSCLAPNNYLLLLLYCHLSYVRIKLISFWNNGWGLELFGRQRPTDWSHGWRGSLLYFVLFIWSLILQLLVIISNVIQSIIYWIFIKCFAFNRPAKISDRNEIVVSQVLNLSWWSSFTNNKNNEQQQQQQKAHHAIVTNVPRFC